MDITTYCPKCFKLLEGSLTSELSCSCGYCLKSQEELMICPICEKSDFYQQKDFNKNLGIALFSLAAILSIFTYGLSFIAFYLVDLFLYKRIPLVIVCYHCESHFRKVPNEKNIPPFDHYKHDMLKYNAKEEV